MTWHFLNLKKSSYCFFLSLHPTNPFDKKTKTFYLKKIILSRTYPKSEKPKTVKKNPIFHSDSKQSCELSNSFTMTDKTKAKGNATFSSSDFNIDCQARGRGFTLFAALIPLRV